MFKIKNKKGMTLIEVVVLIAIIGIISAISIVSLTTSKRTSELDVAAEEVSAVLREAQNYALTGKDISASCGNYVVDFTNGTGNYRLHNGGGSCLLNRLYTLKNGVIVSGSTDTIFIAPHASISGMGVGWRVITLTKGGGASYVCINSAGLIKKSSSAACN